MKSQRMGAGAKLRMWLFPLMAVLLTLLLWIPQGTAADVSDMSLYERASEVTRQFSSALAPGADAEALNLANPGSDGAKITAGNAGGLLGYAEVLEDDVGVVGWLMNEFTSSSVNISYNQLENLIPASADIDSGKANPFFQYAGYGEALTEMGLVNTTREGSMGALGSALFTGILLLVYLAATAAPFIFKASLFLLVELNPFKLFMSVIEGTGNMELGILSEVADYVGGIYMVVQELSITILFPMLLALTAISVLMFRNSSAMKKFARYGVRVFMLFAGLPLIGATYTGVVEGLDSEVETGADYANYLILSSYVDFEGWVRETRLAPPGDVSGLAIKNPRTASDQSVERMGLSDRSLVLNINGNRAGSDVALAMSEKYESSTDISEILSVGGDTVNINDGAPSDEDSEGTYTEVMNLLQRHMGNTLYTSAQYDGEVSGQIQKIRARANNETDGPIIQMFSLTSNENRTWGERIGFGSDVNTKYQEPIEWKDAAGLFTPGAAEEERFQFGNYAYNIYNAGSLTTNGSAYYAPSVRTDSDNGLKPIGNDTVHVVGGLSPLAMYNFLNTTFSDSGLTVFSPKDSSSDIVRDSYTSVAFAGSGVSQWVRYLENVVVMLSLAALSIMYGFMMLTAAIRNIPRILTSVFGTALGSIAFATKLLISTAVMIIQVIGMIFLYTLSENIIMTLLLNFNSVTSTVSSYFGAGTVALEFTRGAMVIGITLIVTIFLIKNMNVFREMMEEVVSNSINRVMGVLDTSTGGQGLDVAKTSGGRIGRDGNLTDDARKQGTLLGGGLTGGVADLMGQAHDIEARREQAEQERNGGKMLNEDGTKQTARQRLANRLETGSDLAGARSKDMAKSLLGIKGKSQDRESDAKMRVINAIPVKSAMKAPGDDSENESHKETGSPNTPTTSNGQKLDEHGNVVRDEHGNALDVNNQPISSNAPVGKAAGVVPAALLDSEGRMTDANGEVYTDENGQAFRQDAKGQLVNDDGEHVALDKDGVLKPLAMVPASEGRPVSALREAQKLDNMRFDADGYAAMQESQEASHYGLDHDGHVVDANGQPLMARTANGVSPVTMNAQGIITDKDGNQINKDDLVGNVDARGFEEDIDDETGATVMRHKGDAAMKPIASAAVATAGANSMTGLAKQANKANARAQQANARVAALRANGASPYAINQAERYAHQAKNQAQKMDAAYSGALKDAGQSRSSSTAMREPVSQAQVEGASRYATRAQSSLAAEQQQLSALQASNAPKQTIAKQARKVEASRAEAQRANQVANDTHVAHQSNRPFGEVHQASTVQQQAEQRFSQSQQAYDKAVQGGASAAVVRKREKAMQQASAELSSARRNVARVSQPPAGTWSEIDQATVAHTEAQQQHAKAQSRVEQLQKQGSPEAVSTAQATEQQAGRRVQQARQTVQQAQQRMQQLTQTNAPRSEVVQAKREVEQATQQAQTAQRAHVNAQKQVEQVKGSKPAPQELNAAKREAQTTRRKVQQTANRRMAVTSPAGWNESDTPTIQPVPKTSATQSFTTLSAEGINNYSDYQERVAAQSASVKEKKMQVAQAQQRLVAMRSSNRPPQLIQKAQADVQQLSSEVKSGQQQLTKLQDHAHGLLKTSRFQPMVANRPLRKNGAVVVNQLVNLGNTQAMLDNLVYQEEAGTLSDAGKRQMASLSTKVNHMRQNLVKTGIREDALRDSATITQSTQQMKQSWDSFLNGTTKEESN